MVDVTQYDFPTTVQFGWGIRSRLPEVLAGCKRPLLLTDENIATFPWWQEALDLLSQFETSVFSDHLGNPTIGSVQVATEAARAHKADAIVAIGGGSVIDIAKSVTLMMGYHGELFDYKEQGRAAEQKIPRLIVLPTTAGSGNEMGRRTIIADRHRIGRMIYFPKRLLPVQVLADPEFTMSMPASVTAATGMETLSHLMEAFLAKGEHAVCDDFALRGIQLVSESLMTAVSCALERVGDTEEHRRAREKMMNASMMGAIAFQKGLGITHCCSYALSAVCQLHHGIGNGIILPYAMAYNRRAVPERFEKMSKAAGIASGDPIALINWLQWMNIEVGIPRRLAAVGVQPDEIEDLVAHAISDPSYAENPREASPDALRRLFQEAI